MDLSPESIRHDLATLGVAPGDVVLVRADLGAVGRIKDGNFLGALLDVVGASGTALSPAFTRSGFPWRASTIPTFTPRSASYAGMLSNAMIAHRHSHRSLHPQCSFVAIGNHARELTDGHGPDAGAYEPIRKLIALKGKMLIVGCVDSSPGFTTTHLAEADLGLYRRRIAPWLSTTRYVDEQHQVRTFRRTDPGLCSISFWKLYSAYVKSGHLTAGKVGKAYSICAPAVECYAIDREILANNSRFCVCDSYDCVACNAMRWDRLYRWPGFVLRRVLRKTKR